MDNNEDMLTIRRADRKKNLIEKAATAVAPAGDLPRIVGGPGLALACQAAGRSRCDIAQWASVWLITSAYNKIVRRIESCSDPLTAAVAPR